MSTYHLIKTDTMREIENHANKIIMCCNEPEPCNVKPEGAI